MNHICSYFKQITSLWYLINYALLLLLGCFMKNIQVNMRDKDAPQKFANALYEYGFAVLTQHPIQASLLQTVYSDWRNFFDSPLKNNYLRNKDTGEGFVPYGVENAKGVAQKDLKEFYHFYPWGRYPLHIHMHSTLKLYQEMTELGNQLVSWLDKTLPTNIAEQLSMPLNRMIDGSDQHLLRILHYPPIESDTTALRSAPHEDINLLTLLPAGTSGGLELMDSHGIWHAVPGGHSVIFVNTADMLDLCTQGYYKSVKHRVTNPIGELATQSRYSLPFFIHPRPEVELKPGFTAQNYLLQRLKEIGLYYDYLYVNNEKVFT